MKTNLDKLYENYVNGFINSKNLTNKIIESIFLEPQRFGVTIMDSDQKSDFIIYLLQKIEPYILRYSKELSLFSNYIISLVYNLRKSWIREFCHTSAHKQSITYYIESEEPKYVLAEHDYAYNEQNDKNISYDNLTSRDKITILVLALKSFFYLEDIHIAHISNVTKISQNDIHELIHNLSL